MQGCFLVLSIPGGQRHNTVVSPDDEIRLLTNISKDITQGPVFQDNADLSPNGIPVRLNLRSVFWEIQFEVKTAVMWVCIFTFRFQIVKYLTYVNFFPVNAYANRL